MIALAPEDSTGYWFRGAALEGLGRDAEALEAYETSLRKFRADRQKARGEPPVLLLRQTKSLREKLRPR